VDPFAPTEVRKVERTLIVEYRAVIGRALDALTPANADIVRELAESADMVRDYEVVQLRNVTGLRATVDELLASMTSTNLSREQNPGEVRGYLRTSCRTPHPVTADRWNDLWRWADARFPVDSSVQPGSTA